MPELALAVSLVLGWVFLEAGIAKRTSDAFVAELNGSWSEFIPGFSTRGHRY